jgi:ABC-2 type transport system ATP-binding protein
MNVTTRPLALEATGLRKAFSETIALDGLDLAVEEGSVFALLGPNGAGKTTTVQILSTLLHADSGEIRVAGHDPVCEPQAVRVAIGVTGQFPAVDNLLTGEENLLLMADLRHLAPEEGRRRAAELLERLDLVDEARRPAATYSGGLRRRLDLAMTLIGEPRIIFLDEPTTGLDPRSRRVVWDLVRELVRGGVTVLLTTHYLEEADELADRVALIDRGRVIAEGTPDELKRLIPGGEITLRFPDREPLTAAARMLAGSQEDAEALELHVAADGGVEALRTALDRLADASIPVDDVAIHTPDLDDVFLTLTDHTDREEAGR